MDERLEQQARNEALVREVNERISVLDRGPGATGDTFGFHTASADAPEAVASASG